MDGCLRDLGMVRMKIHSFIPPLEDSIHNAQATDMPRIGICFGHQIIAQALGGKVAKFDGGWKVGC